MLPHITSAVTNRIDFFQLLQIPRYPIQSTEAHTQKKFLAQENDYKIKLPTHILNEATKFEIFNHRLVKKKKIIG